VWTCRFTLADARSSLIGADINERMARSEATAIFEQIKRIGGYLLPHIDFIMDAIVTLACSANTNTRFRATIAFVTVQHLLEPRLTNFRN
jgi:hypothetical protein